MSLEFSIDTPDGHDGDKDLREQMAKTPAYRFGLKVFRNDPDDTWSAYFFDDLGEWSGQALYADCSSVPGAIIYASAELLEALRDGRCAQGVQNYSGWASRRDEPEAKTPGRLG